MPRSSNGLIYPPGNVGDGLIRLYISAGMLIGVASTALAQTVPPAAIQQFEQVVGNRVEAVTILGGDYGAAGGLYSFRGGNVADVSVNKFGGGGDVASPRPLGFKDLKWAPVLQGNLGFISAENRFASGFLQGNEMQFDTLGVQAGGGVRFYFTDQISLAPLISGIYGHTENEFNPHNSVGQTVKAAATGRYVDWNIDTWSVAPALQFRYQWLWKRTVFELESRYNFFYTEDFASSSPLIHVTGGSHTWENKLDVDVPLGVKIFGHELHTGGFFSGTELSGGVADGLNADRVYTANGRLVIDLLGSVWKTRWLGVGCSYFFADRFSGWSAGVDLRFQF